VFERAERPGGSFRYAGKAPLFQDVVANQESFDLYVRNLEAACAGKGVVFRYSVDLAHSPDVLAPFDRIVIATGAVYRFGLGPLATTLLDLGAGQWPFVRQILSAPAVRDWFYHRARRPTGAGLQVLARPGQKVVVIGDALVAGKSRPAISSAFEAVLRG